MAVQTITLVVCPSALMAGAEARVLRSFVDPGLAFCISGAPPVMLHEPLRFCNVTGLSCCTGEKDAALQNTFLRRIAQLKEPDDISNFKRFLCKTCIISMKTTKPKAEAAADHMVLFIIPVSICAGAGVLCVAQYIWFKMVQEDNQTPTFNCGNGNIFFCCFPGNRERRSDETRSAAARTSDSRPSDQQPHSAAAGAMHQ